MRMASGKFLKWRRNTVVAFLIKCFDDRVVDLKSHGPFDKLYEVLCMERYPAALSHKLLST